MGSDIIFLGNTDHFRCCPCLSVPSSELTGDEDLQNRLWGWRTENPQPPGLTVWTASESTERFWRWTQSNSNNDLKDGCLSCGCSVFWLAYICLHLVMEISSEERRQHQPKVKCRKATKMWKCESPTSLFLLCIDKTTELCLIMKSSCVIYVLLC